MSTSIWEELLNIYGDGEESDRTGLRMGAMLLKEVQTLNGE